MQRVQGDVRLIRSITDDEVATFWRDGVVALRGALDPVGVTAMASAVDEAMHGRESADMTEMAGSLDPSGPSAGLGRFRSGIDHWRTRDAFARFAGVGASSGVAEAVAALFGHARLRLVEDSVLVKEPDTTEVTAWHQDASYFNVDGEHLATTWVPLDPAELATGAMRFVVGSHRSGEVYRPNLFVTDEPIPGTAGESVPDVDADPARFAIVSFALEVGDLTVHHARTLHAAGPNRHPTLARRAISIRYAGDDVVIHHRPGTVAKPWQIGVADGAALGGEHPVVWPPSAAIRA